MAAERKDVRDKQCQINIKSIDAGLSEFISISNIILSFRHQKWGGDLKSLYQPVNFSGTWIWHRAKQMTPITLKDLHRHGSYRVPGMWDKSIIWLIRRKSCHGNCPFNSLNNKDMIPDIGIS